MKKFATTLAIGALTVACAFGFTACGDSNEKEAEVKTTVTENEWKSAIEVLTKGNTSFKSEWDYDYKDDGVEEKVLYVMELDTTDKVCHFYYTYEEDGEKLEFNNYYWVDAEGNAYSAEFDPNKDDLVKRAFEEEDYDEIVSTYIGMYAGVDIITMGGLADKYGEFEYDEASKAYTATLTIEEESADFALKFEDGKLVNLCAKPDEEEAEIIYTFTYTYAVKVSVPQTVLDMSVEEGKN